MAHAAGARAWSTGSLLRERAPVVRWSHERYDGRGYPDGLAGDKIPLGARVICACDAFDAMVSDRPYRRAMTIRAAVRELRAGAALGSNPDVVDALVMSRHPLWPTLASPDL